MIDHRSSMGEGAAMCEHLDRACAGVSRRTLILGGAGAALAAAGATRLLDAGAALAHDPGTVPGPAPAPALAPTAASGPLLQTVTGPVKASSVRWALAHEHLFVDFFGPAAGEYMDVDWSDVTGTCVNSANELRSQGVDLLIDWTNLGVGRNVFLLRDVARQTGLKVVCATGIYKSFVPPAFAKASIDAIAAHFHTELTLGIDGSPVRAGFIKCATTETGPTASDTKIHRAAARAGKRAGATITLHSPHAEAAAAVAATLEKEGFDLRRFLWGHSQVSDSAAHIAMAKRGASVQFDAISANSDPFFHGPTDDASMLDRIQAMIDGGFGDRVVLSTDASVFVNPTKFQYDRDNTYVYRDFIPKLRDRIGEAATKTVLRDNVVRIFRRGDNVR
jgi:phosphotriesterase-related protein